MPRRTLHGGESYKRVLARECSHPGLSCQSGGGHACRERLPQAGLHGANRGRAACRSLNGRRQHHDIDLRPERVRE